MYHCNTPFVTALVLLAGTLCSETASTSGTAGRYASDRSPHKFAGATRVVLEGMDGIDKDTASAMLQLDKNEVTYSPFGDAQLTTVFYKPFPVELSRLKIADPSGKDRRIFSVTLPKEQSEGLGKNTLRLIVPKAAKSEPAPLRLVLVNPDGNVAQALELRPVGN